MSKPNFVAGKLKAFVERIERIEAEIADMNADKSEIYKEAKGTGFDPAIIRQVVRERAKDEQKRTEQGELFDLYWSAIHNENTTVGTKNVPRARTRVHAHETAKPSEMGSEPGARADTRPPMAEAQAPDRAGVSLDDIPIVGAHLAPPPLDDMPDIPPEFDRRPKVAA